MVAWLKRILHWLFVEPRLMWWVFLLGIAPALIYTRWDGTLENCFRYHGLALQLVGVVLVGKGLQDTTKRFQQRGLLGRFVEWFRSFPPRRRNLRLKTEAGAYVSQAGSIAMRVQRNFDTTKPVAERLSRIESVLTSMQSQIDGVAATVSSEAVSIRDDLKKETRVLHAADAEARRLLEKQFTDGLAEGYVGLAFMLLGAVYSSVPKELSDCFVKLLPGP